MNKLHIQKTMTEDFKSPGELIKQVLRERGLTQRSLACVIDLSTSHLSEIINGRRSVTPALAKKLSECLEIPVTALIDLQTRNTLERKIGLQESNDEFLAKLRLEEYDRIICVSSLLKQMKTKKSSFKDKLNWIENHYELENPQSIHTAASNLIDGSFRKSTKTGLDERMITTWVIKARATARTIDIPSIYDYNAISFLKDDLAMALHHNVDTLNQVHSILNLYGIGFAIVEKENNASIDGYSFMIGNTPYIVITKRFNRIDNLAFTVMHELGHIALGHLSNGISKINIPLGDNGQEEDLPQERAANEFASDALIPKDIWRYAPSVPLWPQAIQKKYSAWALKHKFNQWIVLGRISHETGMYRFKSDESRKIDGEYTPNLIRKPLTQKGGFMDF